MTMFRRAMLATFGVAAALLLLYLASAFVIGLSTPLAHQWPESDRAAFRSDFRSVIGVNTSEQADCVSGLMANDGVSYSQRYGLMNGDPLRYRTMELACSKSR